MYLPSCPAIAIAALTVLREAWTQREHIRRPPAFGGAAADACPASRKSLQQTGRHFSSTNMEDRASTAFKIIFPADAKIRIERIDGTVTDFRTTSGDVARIAGVSLRQLQWWDERNVVSPSQEGHRRVYLPQEVVEVSVIAELRRKGFSLQGVRKVMRFLDREFGKGLAEIVSRNSDYHLLTDGTRLYLETSARQIVDILKNSSQPILGICLSDAVRQVRAEVVSRKLNTSVTSSDYRKRARKAS